MTSSFEDINKVILGSTIRKIVLDGETYFSVLDIFKYYGAEANPRSEWNRTKKRLTARGIDVTKKTRVYQFKGKDGKGKMATPVCTSDLIQDIETIWGQQYFVYKSLGRSDMEVTVIQPTLVRYLSNEGWIVRSPFRLASGHVIDIFAERNSQTLIVECKRKLKGDDLFSAIGQVLCYCAEYDAAAIPVLSCPRGKLDDYARTYCEKLGIKIIEIDLPKDLDFD